MTGLAKQTSGIFAPEVIKSYAAEATVKLLLDLHLHMIILEGDCQKVIKMNQSMDTDASASGMLVDDILIDIQNFATWEISRVARKLNNVAHVLINMLVLILMIVYGGTSPQILLLPHLL